MSFKVGDKVRAFGCDGVVTDIFIDVIYPIRVGFANEQFIADFTIEGKYQSWHKEPSLILVERPEPEDNQLYEWAFKSKIMPHEVWLEDIPLTKKQAKEAFENHPEYYLLRKFEPMETFKNKEQE